MADLVNLTEENFESTISKGVVLVDFWAPWCGPCKMLGPVLAEVAEKVGNNAKIAKVNVDEEVSLAKKYNVRSIPAIFIFKDGEVAQQFIGLKGKDELIKAIEEAL